jgi:hypothetical protein
MSKTKIAFYNLVSQLKFLGINITPEFKFCENRKFKADFKLEKDNKIVLIEYEGLFAGKSRHTTLKGYSKDCEKYNLATILGYPILRYTAMNYKSITGDVCKIFGIIVK